MKVLVPNYREIAYRQCLELLKINPLVMSGYYSTLITSFNSLLNMKDRLRLQHMVDAINDWLSDDLNQLTLQEAEPLMYNNLDLYSGFMVNNVMITQLEINMRLEQIKNWLTMKIYEYLPTIRFTQQIRIE